MTREIDPGPIVFFGSGETLPPSGKAHEYVAQKVGNPAKIAILETPAGFEPNSPRVAGNVGDFLQKRLQNYQPDIQIIPARKKGSEYSPDKAELLAPMLSAGWVFMGPGSPTYAVRQLRESLAYEYLVAIHRLGTPISLASAAILAVSAQTLPVYEIYKVGEDLHWKRGLNFLGNYGLDLIFIPHWNNTDGGEELDTSHCYMGLNRFEQLLDLLPRSYKIIGIDEHTSLVLDFQHKIARVMGNGNVTIRDGSDETVIPTGKTIPMASLGDYRIPSPGEVVNSELFQKISEARASLTAGVDRKIPEKIRLLVNQREDARLKKEWSLADQLRDQILDSGWNIQDTPEGPVIVPNNSV